MAYIRTLYGGILSCIIILLTMTAFAEISADVNTLTIGSSNTVASNLLKQNTDEYLQTSITIDTADEISLSVAPLSGYVHDPARRVVNNINVSIVSVQNNTNSSGDVVSQTLTILARIPERLSAVDAQGRETAFRVADLTFSTNETSSIKVPLYMQRQNYLRLDRVTMSYSDKTVRLRNNIRITDLMPGSSATIESRVRNAFGSASRIDIEDVEIFLRDTGNDLDVEDRELIGILRYSEDFTEILSFDVDRNIREQTYGLELFVIGVDEYGARHGERYAIDVRIQRERDEVLFTRLDLFPDSVDNCQDRTATLTTVIENTGRNRQRSASVSVEAPELAYADTISNIELFDGTTANQRFIIVVPEGSRPGIHDVTVQVTNDRGQITDERTLGLVIRSCEPLFRGTDDEREEQPSREQGQTDVRIIFPEDFGVAQPVAPSPALETETTSEERFSDAVLIVLVILIFFGIVGLVIVLLRED
ncbi:MAG: hypothetical protein ACMXYE_04890 [Candidatus Woesearchaeota archaeon]